MAACRSSPAATVTGSSTKTTSCPEEERVVYTRDEDVIDLEVEAGEAVLLHNFMLHRSGPNPTPAARRAFSVTYMKAATRTLDTGQTFPVVFGDGALDPATVGGKAAELVQTFYG